jgi:probable rRNA maturation factor
MSAIEVAVVDHQSCLTVDGGKVRAAVEAALCEGNIQAGSVSVAVVDDRQSHRLNAQFLGHDYPTDALSFPLDWSPGRIDGEIVVNGEMAARAAGQYECLPEDELLLYIAHAALHLAGYDDLDDDSAAEMRAAERRVLARFGVAPRGFEGLREESLAAV